MIRLSSNGSHPAERPDEYKRTNIKDLYKPSVTISKKASLSLAGKMRMGIRTL
jgi:hypothetical protein